MLHVGWFQSILLSAELFILVVYHKRAAQIIKPLEGGTAFFEISLIINIVYYTAVNLLQDRILMYHTYMNLILLASLPSFIREKNLRILMYAGVIAALVLYWVNYYLRHGFHQVWPYRPIGIV